MCDAGQKPARGFVRHPSAGRQTIGLTINGFSGLPVEAPMLWMGITWATIIVYETIYTLLYMRSVGGLGADRFQECQNSIEMSPC